MNYFFDRILTTLIIVEKRPHTIVIKNLLSS